MPYYSGDTIEDIKMVRREKLEKTISIGFLDKKIEQNLTLYRATFDIVLTQNASFDEVKDIYSCEN